MSIWATYMVVMPLFVFEGIYLCVCISVFLGGLGVYSVYLLRDYLVVKKKEVRII